MEKKNPLYLILALSGGFFVLFIVVVVGALYTLSSGKASSTRRLLGSHEKAIGVLEVKGVIADSKKILEELSEFRDDSNIKGIILRINSPGGVVAPSQEIYDALKEVNKEKPVYASLSSLAASGGYYIAVSAKKIFASPGTITGSIGVIMSFANLSKLYDWAKVSQYNIKTGKFKDIGSPTREMTAEEKELLQGMLDNVLMQFRTAVSQGRNLPMEKVIELSDGRIFSGEQAKQSNLVDELGGLDATALALAKEVGMTGKPKLMYPNKKRKFLDLIMEGPDEDAESSNSQLDRVLSAVETLGGLFGKVSRSTQTGSALWGPLFIAPNFTQF